MKTLYSIIILLSSCFGMKEVKSKPDLPATHKALAWQAGNNMQQSTKSFYDFKMKAIDGKEIDNWQLTIDNIAYYLLPTVHCFSGVLYFSNFVTN